MSPCSLTPLDAEALQAVSSTQNGAPQLQGSEHSTAAHLGCINTPTTSTPHARESLKMTHNRLMHACKSASMLAVSVADGVQVLVPHREDVRLEGVDVSQDYLAVQSRSNALQVFYLLCRSACVAVCLTPVPRSCCHDASLHDLAIPR